MAELLKRRYDLVVLKVGLVLPGGERRRIAVRCAVEAKVDGELASLAKCELQPDEFGLPSRIETRQARSGGYEFRVPETVVAMLRDSLADAELAGRPLWLHLAAPYGYLGLVPWERLLVPQLGVPLLRLPDFIVPPPREARRSLDVALCCSRPAAKESFDAVGLLSRVVRQIGEAAPRRRVSLHVFADAFLHHALRDALAGGGYLPELIVYPPPGEYGGPDIGSPLDPGGSLSNPWLLWMREALNGRGIDVVHFACHGYYAGERGALAFSESPAHNEDARIARFVGSGELDAFLTQLGAWSCVFTSPPGNFSDLGLRLLADTLAQRRPMSILYHDAAAEGEGQSLRDAYRFLYAVEPLPPPASPSCFVYCQPSRVPATAAYAKERGALAAPSMAPAPPVPPADDAESFDEIGDGQGVVPGWLAAGERFVEQRRLDIAQAAKQSPSAVAPEIAAAVDTTLERMREILARAVRGEGAPR